MQTDNSVLVKLNDYNLRVNEDLIKHIREVDAKNERIHVLMSHIVNSQLVWLERMSGKSMSVKPFDLFPYDVISGMNHSNHALTKKMLEERDPDEKIRYVTMKRERFENTVSEMFTHLFNHSSYHRGQINQLLVQEGKAAMAADFIVYNRTPIL